MRWRTNLRPSLLPTKNATAAPSKLPTSTSSVPHQSPKKNPPPKLKIPPGNKSTVAAMTSKG